MTQTSRWHRISRACATVLLTCTPSVTAWAQGPGLPAGTAHSQAPQTSPAPAPAPGPVAPAVPTSPPGVPPAAPASPPGVSTAAPASPPALPASQPGLQAAVTNGFLATPSESTGPVRPLTLDEAVKLAMRQSPDLRVATLEIDAAEAGRKSARGLLLPRLRVEGNYMYWFEPATIAFAFGAVSMDFQARESTTWGASVTVAQPLGAFWTIYEGYKIADLGVDVAKIKADAAERDLAFQVTQAYYRLLQTLRIVAIGESSVGQVETQVKRARAFAEQGVVARNDVLRAELGLANANQRVIAARGQVTMARAALAFAIGISPDTAIEPKTVPPVEATLAPIPPLADVEKVALANRVEIRQIDTQLAMARAGVSAAKSRLVPQLNLVGSYQHSDGSAFSIEDAYFVGATLAWDAWDWGNLYYGIPQAKARVSQAEAGRAKVADAILLDARSAHVQLTTSAQALAVARQAVVQAEENYRIETRRYEEAASTSFDVLDAETQLTLARAQLETAFYDYLIARASLARAMGETVGGPGGPP